MATLKQTNRGLLADARKAPGRPMRRALDPDGLTLEVVQLDNGNVQLTLEGLNTAPTQQQWDKILAACPEHVPAGVVPIPRKEGRRYALIGRWARPAEVGISAAR